MRRSRQEVEARGWRKRDIRRSIVVGVCERSGSCPVLGGREGIEDARYYLRRLRSREQAVVGEGRQIDRAEDREH